MPLIKLNPAPFVNWVFTCRNNAEKVRMEKLAKEYVKAVLLGYNKARLDLAKTELDFTLRGKFVPIDGKPTKFRFAPNLFRDPRTGGGPGATKEPPPPPQPGL